MRIIILHHLHFIWWEVEGSCIWEETYFSLLIKTSPQRQLHVLCQSNNISSNQSYLSLYSPFTVLLLIWSQLFSGCNDRQASCLPKNQREFPRDVIIQGSLCEYAQLSISFGFKNYLKIQNIFKIRNDASMSSLRPKKNGEKFQFAWIKDGLCPDLSGRWHGIMGRCPQLCTKFHSLAEPTLPLSSGLDVLMCESLWNARTATPPHLGTFKMCAGSWGLPGW